MMKAEKFVGINHTVCVAMMVFHVIGALHNCVYGSDIYNSLLSHCY